MFLRRPGPLWLSQAADWNPCNLSPKLSAGMPSLAMYRISRT
ncbi:UNVERIFIED_CONTAM: hypothetical protein GTU68_010810 [Idotea baltica]|nr:hypothetical protein [Idotea baltica]